MPLRSFASNSFESIRSYGLILIISIYPLKAPSQSNCCGDNCNLNLKRQFLSSYDLLKKTQYNYAKSNIKDFCRRNMVLRYLNAENKAPSEPMALPLEELEAIADKEIQKFTLTPWNLTLISTEQSRNLAMKRTIEWYLKDPNKEDKNGNSFDLALIMSTPNPAPTAHLEKVKNIIETNTKKVSMPFKEGSIKTQALKKVACADVSFSDIGECSRGLDVIQSQLSPVRIKSDAIVDPQLWIKILGSNKYDEGIRLASLKLLERVQKTPEDSANIFDDLKESFSKSGMSPPEAEEATWDLLGFIASGGPNTSTRLESIKETSTQRGLGLSFIASTLSYLDYKKLKNEQSMYSYPSNVKTKCDNAKPYHFWMTSYISRKLVQEHSISPDAAAHATFAATKGYQLKRVVGGNTGSTVGGVFSRAPYDPVHQIIRTDIAFSAAGAIFGSSNGSNVKIDVDEGLLKLMEDSKPLPRISKKRGNQMGLIQSYLRFSSLFSPDSALEILEEE